MSFDDFAKVMSLCRRLPNGCVQWQGTINGAGVPVVRIGTRVRGVRALLRELLHGKRSIATQGCDTEGCVHSRHDRRLRPSTSAVLS